MLDGAHQVKPMTLKKQKNNILSIIFLSLYSLVLLSVPVFAYAAESSKFLPCTPTEHAAQAPGETRTVANTDLFDCVNQLYKYALIISSIAAVFMIIIAGYMYIFSGGDSGKVSTAKSFITTSLLGIAVLLTGFLLLKQINPNLLVLKNITPQQIGQRNWAYIGSGGITYGSADNKVPGGVGPAGGGVVGNVPGNNGVSCNGGIDKSPSVHVDCNCRSTEITNSANKYSIDPALLRAVIYQETKCGADIRTSSAGAVGIMQILPSTGNNAIYDGKKCALNWASDIQANIDCAAIILKNLQLQYGRDGVKYVLASYNTDPRKSMPASSFCPGMRRFECPFDNAEHTICNDKPGSYDETRNYVVSAQRFYNEAQACR